MGAGRLLNRLQADGWSATGVDAAHGMVVLAEHRLAGGGGAVVQGRIEALPLRSGTYDAAVASGVLEYVDDLTTALQELARVVRTSGDVVVTMPNAAALPLVWAHYVWYPLVRAVKRLLPVGRPAPPPAPGPVTLRRLRALLKARALLCTDVQYVGLRPFPAPLPDLMPRVAGRLARWLEPRMRIGRRLLATQIVVSTIRVR
jgi:SAM-dependent methyltransferase